MRWTCWTSEPASKRNMEPLFTPLSRYCSLKHKDIINLFSVSVYFDLFIYVYLTFLWHLLNSLSLQKKKRCNSLLNILIFSSGCFKAPAGCITLMLLRWHHSCQCSDEWRLVIYFKCLVQRDETASLLFTQAEVN